MKKRIERVDVDIIFPNYDMNKGGQYSSRHPIAYSWYEQVGSIRLGILLPTPDMNRGEHSSRHLITYSWYERNEGEEYSSDHLITCFLWRRGGRGLICISRGRGIWSGKQTEPSSSRTKKNLNFLCAWDSLYMIAIHDATRLNVT